MAKKERGENSYIECLMTQFRAVYRKQKELKRPLCNWRRRYYNIEGAIATCIDIHEGVSMNNDSVAEDLADLVLEMLVSIDYKYIPDKETLKGQILTMGTVWRYDLIPLYIPIDIHSSMSDDLRMTKAFKHIVKKKIRDYLIRHNPRFARNGCAYSSQIQRKTLKFSS